jgi:PIN domain nuclease of toxin-antitoxin system
MTFVPSGKSRASLAQHVEPLTTLPLHHRDPFDRLIAATALVEGLTVVSADAAFDAYGLPRLW